MKVTYKKTIAESRKTGGLIVQTIPLKIHYEAKSCFCDTILQAEPYDLGSVIESDNVVYLNGEAAELSTLTLIVEDDR